MGLSDPFSTTYEGARQSKKDVMGFVGGLAGEAYKDKQVQDNRKQALGLLKQFGMINTTTEEPSLEELTQGAKEFAKQQGHDLQINTGDNPEQAKQNLMGIYKALNIPLPQGKTTTTLNLAPGTKYDPMKGEVSFDTQSKSLVQQLGMMKEQDKKENAKQIADDIQSGNQLADFQSLYGLAGPVKAELQRRGVDV